MAFDAGSVVVKFLANTTAFNGSIKQAQSSLNSLQSSGSKVFGQLNTAIDSTWNTLVRGGTIFAGLSAAATGFAIKQTAEFEQARIAFDTLVGSVEKGGKLMEDVLIFAEKTPFDPPELVQGTKKLLAYGVALDDVLPLLKDLGDVSAGVGKEEMPRLVRAMGQIKAKTKLVGSELLQLNETGIPIVAALAEVTGHSAEEITGDTAKLGISYDQVREAIGSMTQEGGKFFNLMEKQSASFGGIMSNLIEVIGSTSREILGMNKAGDIQGGSIFERLKWGAEAFLNFLTQEKGFMKDVITDIVNSFTEAIGKSTDSFLDGKSPAEKFEEIVTKVKDAFIKLIPFLVKAGEFIVKLSIFIAENIDKIVILTASLKGFQILAKFGGFAKNVWDLAGALGKLAGLKGVGASLGGLGAGLVVGGTVTAIALVVDGMIKYNDELERGKELAKGVTDSGQKLNEKITEEMKARDENVKSIMEQIEAIEEDGEIKDDEIERYKVLNEELALETEALDGVNKKYEENQERVREANEAMEEFTDNERWWGFKGVLDEALISVDGFFVNLSAKLASKLLELFGLPPITDEQIAWFMGLPVGERIELFKQMMANGWDLLKEIIANKWEEIKENIATKWEEIKENIRNKIEETKEILRNKWEEMKENVRNKWEEIKTNIRNKWEEIKENIAEKIRNIITVVRDGITDIVNFFSSMPTDIGNAMAGGFSGLLEKFKGWLGDMWDVATEMAGNIREAISEAFNADKHNSPSINDRLRMLKGDIELGFRNIQALQTPNFAPQIAGDLATSGAGGEIEKTVNNNITVNAEVSDELDIDLLSERIAFNIKQTS